MSPTPLRLESFGQGVIPAHLPPTAADVAQAYQDGLSQGLAQGRQADIDTLAVELRRTGVAMRDAMTETARLRQQTLASVEPVLCAIVEALGAASSQARLLDAIRHELAAMLQQDGPAKLEISCAPHLHDAVRACLDRAMTDVALTDADLQTTTAEIRIRGGLIRLDPDLTIQRMKTLISELSIEE